MTKLTVDTQLRVYMTWTNVLLVVAHLMTYCLHFMIVDYSKP